MSLLSDPVIEVTKQLESVAEDRRSTGSVGSPAGHDLNDETVDGNQKAGTLHQLRLIGYPIIYRVLGRSQVVVWDF